MNGKTKTMNEENAFRLPPGQRPPGGRHPDAPDTPEPYVAAPELMMAVNLAIYLRRPLLLEGDAGCGKSRLARHVAHELGLPFYEWFVRSTSRAQDGLYTYDAILRLHDVHIKQLEPDRSANKGQGSPATTRRRDPERPMDYVTYGALGKAFRLRECPAVVLIDEIDKADIDFPNDLLTVLDQPWKFEIREADEPDVTAAFPPIVIITSNKEKGNLPAPFLRRCVYFYIEFPSDPKRLRSIVDAHYRQRQEIEKIEPPVPELTEAAAERFLKVRGKGDLYKKPGTSEFLDWLEALRGFQDLPRVADRLRDENARLPYPELLFKLRADWQRHATAS
jgi:MoxR-like ATPase